ncbi:MAG: hypothetical protein DRO90_00865 [Candidatus Altiarchaeales archaeon]|nr:MAG: hypothetical protein DRO95_01330 [Candidatus Altiarchaeales archaeon]RLI95082.1 MAG: hypothetical protein DRO94_01380 [Candidatus Altiarchaeales archaeon]RLI95117.1 MAG: hypothetical protein DRO90_00865 [Candidatus Altiarchaeales archaeon]HDO82199.1 hypothetical protein [Candidatus Altiarchaeales archaeon]HEX54848.1 hypothetical protein [Candidatus Altiarchaeales archaeon]
MAIKDIEKNIREDAKKRIDEINREMNETIKIIREEIENEIEKRVGEIRRDGEREAELTYKRIVTSANMKSKEIIEREKNELVEKVFKEARNRILNASDKEKTRILKILIEKGKEVIEDPIILVDKRYGSLVGKCKKADINDFGVILKSKDGYVTVDNTLNTIIKYSKVKLKPKIASILFK